MDARAGIFAMNIHGIPFSMIWQDSQWPALAWAGLVLFAPLRWLNIQQHSAASAGRAIVSGVVAFVLACIAWFVFLWIGLLGIEGHMSGHTATLSLFSYAWVLQLMFAIRVALYRYPKRGASK